MAAIELGIVYRLKSLADVATLVGTRIYQLKLPQKPTLPAVRVQQIGETEDYHLRGPVPIYRTRIQVDAYADEAAGDPYANAAAVANAIHGDGLGANATGLDGFVGDLGGSPALWRMYAIRRDGRRPMYEPGELRLVRIQQDYIVDWSEMT